MTHVLMFCALKKHSNEAFNDSGGNIYELEQNEKEY